MARKTAIRITNAELRLREAKADALKDIPLVSGKPGLVPTIAELRARRGALEDRELLRRANDAARLELRGADFSAEDRADVAAQIVATLIAERPDRNALIMDGPRVSLHRCCDLAKVLRRSLDCQRARDHAEYERNLDAVALSPAALGIDNTPADAVAVLSRAGAQGAAQAATAICEDLGLPAEPDSPAWCVMYQWARGISGERCAAERGVTWGAWKVRAHRGAKFLREFYSAAELADKLTLGARETANGELVIVTADLSREAVARGKTWTGRQLRQIAARWREGTDAGNRPEPPQDEHSARAACKVSRTRKRTAKLAGPDRAQRVADSLRQLATDYARNAQAKPKASPRVSDLGRAQALEG